jgi:hypothetical protein
MTPFKRSKGTDSDTLMPVAVYAPISLPPLLPPLASAMDDLGITLAPMAEAPPTGAMGLGSFAHWQAAPAAFNWTAIVPVDEAVPAAIGGAPAIDEAAPAIAEAGQGSMGSRAGICERWRKELREEGAPLEVGTASVEPDISPISPEAAPAIAEAAPAIAEAAPAIDTAAPAIDEADPSLRARPGRGWAPPAAPAIDEAVVMAIDQAAPAIDEVAAAIDDAAPAIDAAAPAINEEPRAPAIEEAAPATWSVGIPRWKPPAQAKIPRWKPPQCPSHRRGGPRSAQAIDDAAPAIDEAAPAIDEAAPAIDETTRVASPSQRPLTAGAIPLPPALPQWPRPRKRKRTWPEKPLVGEFGLNELGGRLHPDRACRFYFRDGECRDGVNCRYSHDPRIAAGHKFVRGSAGRPPYPRGPPPPCASGASSSSSGSTAVPTWTAAAPPSAGPRQPRYPPPSVGPRQPAYPPHSAGPRQHREYPKVPEFGKH